MQKKQNNNKPKTKVSKKIVKYNAPVATTKVVKTTQPKIKNFGGSVRVQHREFIADVTGFAAFSSAQAYTINPGLITTFPWLSAISRRFESYRFNSLKFTYETAAPTSTTGSVILALDYDPTDLAPVSKTMALSYKSAVRSSPWQTCCLTCDVSDLHKRNTYFVRGTFVLPTDLHLYDIGNLFVCVSGQAGATAIGELYVEYNVDLMTPQLESMDTLSRQISAGAGIDTANPFGLAQVILGGLPVTWNNTTEKFTFGAAADYYFVWIAVGTGIVEPTFTADVGVTFTKITNNISGGTNLTYVARIRCTAPGLGVLVNDTSGWTTLTASKAQFNSCNYSDLS